MDTGSLLLILSITILSGLYVARPFYKAGSSANAKNSSDETLSFQEQALLDLMEEKDRIFSELQELDTDFSMGKVLADEYPALRKELKSRAAEVLKRFEEMESNMQAGEKAISLAETTRPETASDNKMDEIEDMVAARRRSRNEKSAGFCPRCGKVIQQSDVYCPVCGIKVA